MIYEFLTDLTGPYLRRHLARRVARGKEEAARVGERYGIAAIQRPSGKLIWFHAASVGEGIALLALIQAIVVRYPNTHILVTSGTVSSAKILAARLPVNAIHQYVPLDRRAWVDAFLNHWQPDAAIWTESEIWPNLLRGLQKRGVPVAMVNGRLSEASAKNWRRLFGFLGNLLRVFRVRLAQSEADAARFASFGVEFRHVGNLKLAVEPAPVDLEASQALKTAIGTRPVWLAASTHPGEEEIAIAVHRVLAKQHPGLLTIIVPRHPERGGEIAAMAEGQGLPVTRRSQGALPQKGSGVYLGDTLGELGTFYTVAPIVFVGGSLTFDGHSPMEAAQCGAAIVYGPLMRNNASIAALLQKNGGAIQVQDSEGLQGVIAAWLDDKAAAAGIGARAQVIAAQGQGVVDRIMTELHPIFDTAGLG